MTETRIPSGQTFLMASPSYYDDGAEVVTGVFRATEDLDLDALGARFIALGADVVAGPGPRLGSEFGPHDHIDNSDVNFQFWLVREGLVERVPSLTLRVSTEYTRGQDGEQQPRAMRFDVSEPPEDAPTPVQGTRGP